MELGVRKVVSTPFFFLDFVGRVCLVENVKVVLDPFDQLTDDVPLVAPVKLIRPVPGALGEGEQRLTDTVVATLPLNVRQVPLTGLGFGVADATPGTTTARANVGMVSAETSATTRADRDWCIRTPLWVTLVSGPPVRGARVRALGQAWNTSGMCRGFVSFRRAPR
jgi:hypothetical protein